ncbi:hypothetical protein [Psychrobacillus psychrodurans]|uniref:hypothetical protein n=1 Tax=Psychrobacillus psychrodurans TaxID=126157 RepID=UPI003D066469
MPLQNTFTLDVDFKVRNLINEPIVTQNDEVTFILNVYDDGQEFALSSVSTFTLASVRPDKVSVMTLGELTGTNQVTFALGSTELLVPGTVDVAIQLYDADGRVSTLPFTYKVLKDPVKDYVPSTDEQTLIELVLGQGPVILEEAKRVATETAVAEALRVTAESNRVTAETERVGAETSRVTSEGDRVSNESTRVESESARQTAETARNQAEEEREIYTSTAIQNAETATRVATNATEAINLVLPNVLNLEYIAPYNAETQYLKNNIVRKDKNSYIALQPTLGNEPTGTTDSPFWGVVAIGGVDGTGTGTVTSVNGIEPENGNVTLVIPNPDLSGLATKLELEDVDDTLTNHLAETMSHSQQGVTYYVRPDGDDNNLGTIDNRTGAFRNIQTAINKLKKYIRGTAKIRILPGDYSSEGQIKMEGFYGPGRIVITAYDGLSDVQNTDSSDSYGIDSLFINNCRNGIDVFSLKSTYSGSERSGFYAINSSFVFFGWCRDTVESSVKIGFLFEVGSTGTCVGCLCSNKGVALEVRNSRVNSTSWLPGNANSIGLKVIQVGVVGKGYTQPQSTIMEITDSGGVIR